MKKLLFAIMLGMAMTACQQNSYKLEGTVQGLADGDTIYLTNNLNSTEPIDSFIVKDGRFEYSAKADTVELTLIYSANRSASALFFTEPGTITINLSTDPSQTSIGGTKVNDGWQQIATLSNEYGQKEMKLTEQLYSGELNEAASEKLYEEMQAVENEMQQKLVEIVEQNIDNELGYFFMANLTDFDDNFTPEKCKELIGRMPAKFRQRESIVAMEEVLTKAESTAVGKTIPDFGFPTPEGEELSAMSEISKHKITILDFWASWCGPCRQEMPFMKELYQKYQSKGLGIIGVSLDQEQNAWTNAIKELGIAWPQMSDLKGWDSQAVELFQFHAVPFMIIVDQQGTILAKGLRGNALSDFISSQLD